MKDKQRFEHILHHYNELCFELKNYEEEADPKRKELIYKKAIYMDLFQIGEHINNLSDETKAKLSANDLRGVINIRNFIGHGYVVLDDEIIWDSIRNDCPRLIEALQKIFG